jgi:DNA-binding SARP family transcriptional activator
MLCLLGNFRLYKTGRPVAVRAGGKTERLLYTLGIKHGAWTQREALLETLWPGGEAALASQSLNSLVYSLHKLLGDALEQRPPVVHQDGCYRLNGEAGVGVDVAVFDALASAGDRQAGQGDRAGATAAYHQALGLYSGDLIGDGQLRAVLQRERLRALYLSVLARLADFAYESGALEACLEYAQRLLDSDPCREDAHRLLMRCFVKRGERAQALRQYRLCEQILLAEFEALPEPRTTALFDQVRRDPGSL